MDEGADLETGRGQDAIPGAATTMVFGINAAGDLVGAAEDSAGTQHGFLATRVRNPRR